MGEFFTSPQQRAGQDLFAGAEAGRPVGMDALNRMFETQLSGLRGETSNRIGSMGGDILSRGASAGLAPGSGLEGIIGKNTQGILAGEQGAEAQLGVAQQGNFLQLLQQQLYQSLGMLPNSSTFGDILAGLTTVSNIGQGVGGLLSGLKGIPSLSGLTGSGGQIQPTNYTPDPFGGKTYG